jgi:hypothetical protein
LNTDGVPVFKSCKFSLWPILYSINELDYELARSNIFTLGLWFGPNPNKPNFHTFLEPFVGVVKDLANTGMQWTCDNTIIKSRIFFPILVAGSVTRPIVLGLLQFNGSYGCTWCLSKGKSLQLSEKSHK